MHHSHSWRWSTAFVSAGLALAGTLPACQIADPKPKRTQQPAPIAAQDASTTQPATRVEAPVLSGLDVANSREKAIAIIEAYAKSQDAQLRANAVELAGISPKRLHDVIQAGLLDTNPGVRSVALVTVGRNKMQEFREIVRPLSRDANAQVRASAIYALTRFGDSPDQTPLASLLLTDDSPWVNRHAAFILGEVGNPSALPLLQNASATRVPLVPPAQQRVFQIQLTEAMVKVGAEEQRAALIAALYPTQGEDVEVAMLAIQAIGETGDKSAVAQLIGLAQYKDRQGNPYPAELRLAIASTLGRLGMDAGIPVARENVASKDEGIRAQAAHALGHIGAGANRGQALIGVVAPMLDDQSDLVKLAASGAVLRCTK